MKHMKKVLVVLLCAAMLLTTLAACGGGDDSGLGNVTYGRYVEQDISPEGMRGFPVVFEAFADGTLDLISADYASEENNFLAEYMRWRSTDNGESWTQVDMGWTKEYIHDYSEYYNRGETPPESISLGSMMLMEGGDVVFQVYRSLYDAATQTYTDQSEIFRIGLDGEKTPFSIPALEQANAEGSSVSVYDMQSLPGGKMYLYLYKQPSEAEMNDPNYNWESAETRGVYDVATGEKLYDIEGNGWEIFYNSETLFMNDYEEGMKAFNLADGTPATIEMPKEELMQQLSQGYMGSIFVDDDYNYFTIGSRGMEKINAESEEFETVMEGLNYTFGSPLYGINSVVYDQASNSVVLAVYDAYDYENLKGNVLRYVWDDNAIASSDKKIRVYSLYENYTVRLALSEFKRQNPDVTVEYETAFSEDPNSGMIMYRGGGDNGGGESSAKTEEDALRALNTELLNGTGPDILILDGLPVESFIEKGVLEDLSGQLAGNDDLLKNLIDPMYTDGKLYAVPTNFFIPALVGEVGYADTFTDFGALVSAIEEGPNPPAYVEYDPNWTKEEQDAYYEQMYGRRPTEEQPVLYFETLDDVFNTFYATCAPGIFSEKGGINQENLATFLQSVKRMADKFGLADDEHMGYGGSYSAMSMGYAYYEYSQSLNRYTSYQSRLGYSRLGSLNILNSVSYSLYYNANPDSGKGVVVAEDGVAVTDNADGQDDAPANEEKLPEANPVAVAAPGLVDGAYFPVQIVGVTSTSTQKELARAFVDTMLSEGVQKYDMGNGFPVSRSAFAYQYESYMRRDQYMVEEGITMMPFDYEGIVSGLNTPFYANDYLRAAIQAPVMEYCKGTIELDEAVSRVVKETELYFAERQ